MKSGLSENLIEWNMIKLNNNDNGFNYLESRTPIVQFLSTRQLSLCVFL